MVLPHLNPQKASEDFSFGSKAWNEFYHGRNKDKKKPGKPRQTPAQKEKAFLNEDERRNEELRQEHLQDQKKYARILGPGLKAQAVKIAKISLEPFDFRDVDLFEEEGWKVIGAGSIQARRTEKNPDPPLEDGGVARALVLLGPVDVAMVKHLRSRHQVDSFPAPKSYREGIVKNPEPQTRKKVYAKVKAITQAGQAWNLLELSNALHLPVDVVDTSLSALAKNGLVHSPGSDMFGPVWSAGALQRGLFANPKRGAKAIKKALAWNGRESLVTSPKNIHVKDNLEFVEIGRIVAIEYESNKFDGKTRIYRHDVTKSRILHVSTDGTVLIVKPGFKITKRGIEG